MTDAGVTPIVELRFPVHGECLPVDHGWPLYGAVSHLNADIHNMEAIRVGPLEGCVYQGKKTLRVTRESFLPVRTPSDFTRHVYSLAGQSLQVRQHTVSLGVPRVRMLTPSSALHARIVIISNRPEWFPFEQELRRQLDALGVSADIQPGRRRVMRIKGFTNIGFAVGLHNLSDEDSLRLQARGIGGRRAMGAGFLRHGDLPKRALAKPEDSQPSHRLQS